MQAQERLLRWQLWFDQFSFSIEHTQGSKNYLTNSLTRELANSDHQGRTPTGKGKNPI